MMGTIRYNDLMTPVGRLFVASSEKGLMRILFPAEEGADPLATLRNESPDADLMEGQGENEPVCRQLEEYFEETRTEFQIPLDLRGTQFQKTVWNAVTRVPYGQTRSYAQIAGDIGNPGSVRAVGAANGANPVPIVIPCHRILGADGSLTGYGGGIRVKRSLLVLEKILLL